MFEIGPVCDLSFPVQRGKIFLAHPVFYRNSQVSMALFASLYSLLLNSDFPNYAASLDL